MSDDYRVEVFDYDFDVNAKIRELGYDPVNSVLFLHYNFEESKTQKKI